MDYSMIGKINKAKIYAEERDRIKFLNFQVELRGDNDVTHIVSYDAGEWTCDCDYFGSRSICSHTMAIERILVDMVEIGEAAY